MDLNQLSETPPWDWPKGAARTLRQLLRDPGANAAERLLAVELAADITSMDDETAEALLRVVQRATESEELRGEAAIALGPVLEVADDETGDQGFDDPEAVPISEAMFHRIKETLRKAYSDTAIPKLVRRKILEASVRSTADWHEGAIREAYATGDPDWVLTAIFAMQSVGGFEKEVLEALTSDNALIHMEAVIAAGNKELPEAWPHIRQLLEDPLAEKALRLAAIDAAGNFNTPESREFLMDLKYSEDEDIAAAADEAMLFAGPEDEEEDDEDD